MRIFKSFRFNWIEEVGGDNRLKGLYGFILHSPFRKFEISVKIKAAVNPNLLLILEFIASGIHWKVFVVDYGSRGVIRLRGCFPIGKLKSRRMWPTFFLSALLLSIPLKVNDRKKICSLTFSNPQIRSQASIHLCTKHSKALRRNESIFALQIITDWKVFIVF